MTAPPAAFQHVLDEVDREVTRRYPPGVRLLLDLARAGRCGQHEPDERAARSAQVTGEWNEDRASSDAFLDLAWALRNLSPEHESGELCARALAEAWRREYPFRRGRDGDPLDVLLPHQDDAGAARALDRARALPRPPVGLMQLVQKVERMLGGGMVNVPPQESFDRQFALALLLEAERLLEELVNEHPHLGGSGRHELDVLRRLRRWVLGPRVYAPDLDYGNEYPHLFRELYDAYGDVDDMPVEARSAVDAAGKALNYVVVYNTAISRLNEARENLERNRAEATSLHRDWAWGTLPEAMIEKYEVEVRRYEALFPDEDV